MSQVVLLAYFVKDVKNSKNFLAACMLEHYLVIKSI